MKNIKIVVATIAFCILSTGAYAVPHGVVTIFHAGSLTVPMQAIEKAFEVKYPQVDVQREPSGSSKAARKITDIHKPCDIMASADYKVIDKLLRPDYTDNNIRFASNRMVLCYTDQSRFADTINEKNWMDILQRPEVVWGHSAPDLDPCGYRTLMVLQLAEKYYQRNGLAQKIIANRPDRNVRPKAVALISLLQTGNMDYAWEYRSVAVQHGLKFIEMPAEINLGDYRFDNNYATATVKVSGKKPGTFMTMTGKSITYGITLLKDAPNREAAITFLAFMLDADGGLKILKQMGQPPFVPARVSSPEMKNLLPEQLQSLVTVQQ
ncbi:MAG: tungstate ABC transporter substrate-binding protein WtpA [Desulfuromusa sp.]|nr:tungstate ABC transporter substrate-binding protein WtpA [Desulfuromusa sp.]